MGCLATRLLQEARLHPSEKSTDLQALLFREIDTAFVEIPTRKSLPAMPRVDSPRIRKPAPPKLQRLEIPASVHRLPTQGEHRNPAPQPQPDLARKIRSRLNRRKRKAHLRPAHRAKARLIGQSGPAHRAKHGSPLHRAPVTRMSHPPLRSPIHSTAIPQGACTSSLQ